MLVEVNVGVIDAASNPDPRVDLAQRIAASRHLRFAGLHAYQGAAQHARTPARKAAIAWAVQYVCITVEALQANGLKPEIITGAGTGTYMLEAASGVYNEIQPGSYIFMDADYNRNLGEDGKPTHAFEQSLYVWATVMSHASPERAVVDAGLKALSVDSGMPLVADLPGVEFLKASDEHGVLKLAPGTHVTVGDKLRLVPGHCDPTVNLYDWIVGLRADKVECVWPVTARGAFY